MKVRAGQWWVAMAAVVALVAAGGCGGSDGGESADPSPTGRAPSTPAPTGSPVEPGPGEQWLTMSSGDEAREVLMVAPDDYDPAEPIPLVVVLHAGRSHARSIRLESGMDEVAQEHGVLVAYPEGVGGWWRPEVEGGHGVAVEWGGDPVDVDFLRELVAQLVAEWNVAPGEVYATGHSNGAAMSYRLAVEAAGVFAAVAPVGGYIFAPPESVDPAEPVSVVGFVGQSNEYTEEIAKGMEIWRELLDCEPGEPEPGGDDRVTRTVATCRNGSEVVQYDIESMGHVWPTPSHGVDASEAMWEFFAEHARAG